MAPSTQNKGTTPDLSRFALLSIAAAILTIALKTAAWAATGSVGLLSDAAESVVNLVAAACTFYALRLAVKPPDRGHQYGHSKAEYFSAAIEGQMIFIAAVVIIWSAIDRLVNPQPLETISVGLMLSLVATAINGVVATILFRVGRKHRSAALQADGHHLMTDVWTSAGVVVGIGLVWFTGWNWLDPLVALAVGVNIIVMGWKLLRDSADALMDKSWPKADNKKLASVLRDFTTPDVHFHALRTREAGGVRFAEVHVLVPGEWSVQRGHDLMEDVEESVAKHFPEANLTCHLEPSGDPRSYDDFLTEIPIKSEDSTNPT